MGTTVLRAVIAVAAGVLMVEYREEMVKWLTILVGILFFVSGFISVVWYYVVRRKYARELLAAENDPDAIKAVKARRPTLPIVGTGCALLGIILALLPETVAKYLVCVFAVLLAIGAVGEFIVLISANIARRDFRKSLSGTAPAKSGWLFFVLPTLLLLFAIIAILYPAFIVSAPLLFLGVAFIVYGLSEIINLIKTTTIRKTISGATVIDVESSPVDAAEEAEIVNTTAGSGERDNPETM
ncbi:MAG: DUF308 domain-containing protein [Prevotella sp.]|nr:DUF308 domain-containing protein [Prevotella sp.]